MLAGAQPSFIADKQSVGSSVKCKPLHRVSAAQPLRARCLAQRLVDVPQDVVRLLDADGQADHVGADAGAGQLILAQLAMGGRCGMDHQRLGVADVGQVAQEFAGVDEAFAGRGRVGGLDAEGEDARAPGSPSMLRNCFLANAWCGEFSRPG